MKICVLIISAPKGQSDRWDYERTVWQRYMHTHPHIDCFFLESHKEKQCIEDDIIYARCEDSLKHGVLVKTLTALGLVKGRYDYYIRTNLSTFVILDRLYDVVCTLPKGDDQQIVYTGKISHDDCFVMSDTDGHNHLKRLKYIGGTGIFMNDSAVGFLLDNIATTVPASNYHRLYDDVVIGFVFQERGISLRDFSQISDLYFWDDSKSFDHNLQFIRDNQCIQVRTKDMHNKVSDSETLLKFHYAHAKMV